MQPLVSIYIPTHNRRPMLEKAADSVIHQTYKNIEIIVSDDGSTDDTMEYLEKTQKTESRLIAVRSNEPSGAPVARNRAIRLASGYFITGLDDDDQFRKDRIEKFVKTWEITSNYEAVSCLFSQSMLVNGQVKWITTDRKSIVNFPDMFQHNFIGNQIFCPTSNLIKAGLFDETMPAWQDMDLFMRVLQCFGPANLIDEPTYICDVAIDRQRISRSETRIRSACEKLIKKYADLPSSMHRDLFMQMFSRFYGITPSAADWRRLWNWGLRRNDAFCLLRATLTDWKAKIG